LNNFRVITTEAVKVGSAVAQSAVLAQIAMALYVCMYVRLVRPSWFNVMYRKGDVCARVCFECVYIYTYI